MTTAKFTTPANEQEAAIIMTVLEINGDRCLVQYELGWTINPTAVILLSEITIIS